MDGSARQAAFYQFDRAVMGGLIILKVRVLSLL